MEGIEMTKQERESMLYDEFDKFTSDPGESIHSYYLRYAKLITRDLHSMNFDQLYAFLKQNEKNAKEVREMRQRFPEPLALLANTYNPPSSYNSQRIHYAPTVVQQPPTLQPDTGFVVPTFLPTDDPIAKLKLQFKTAKLRFRMFKVDSLKVMWAMLERIKLQEKGLSIQLEMQGQINQGVKDSTWFKDKMLLAQAQEAGVVLNDKQQNFLADSLEKTNDCEDLQVQATTNFKADHVDVYDSECDDEGTSNAIFMANLSPVGSINDDTVEPRYDSDILFEVPHYDTYHESDVLNDIQELEYIENIVFNNEAYDELTSNNNVISYAGYMVTISNDEDNYVPPPVQNIDRILSVIEHMKTQVKKCNMVDQETQSVNESLTSELEQYKERVKTLDNKSKNSASDREKFLDCELRTIICDRNRKVSDYENQVFSQ
ncbi:hypothetical protein Tco_0692911 [Tanacetum coccineum]